MFYNNGEVINNTGYVPYIKLSNLVDRLLIDRLLIMIDHNRAVPLILLVGEGMVVLEK